MFNESVSGCARPKQKRSTVDCVDGGGEAATLNG